MQAVYAPLLSIQNPSPKKLKEGNPEQDSKIFLDYDFFQLCFFRAPKMPSLNISGPGFWILTEGPAFGLPCPNSIQVLGIKQPSVYM